MLKRAKHHLPAALGLLATLAAASFFAAEASPAAPAATPVPVINSGDTAFVLIAAALVLLMTPGLGLFYGGMVRRKNVLATITQSFAMMAVVSILWVVCGYSLAFAPDAFHGLIGNLDWVGLKGVGQIPYAIYSATIPHLGFMAFQMKFAIITPALIAGAFAERQKFSAFLLFSVLWALLVYSPVCHWVWGQGGFIHEWGFLDFAGGTVVHILSGFSALAAAIYIGRRKGLGDEDMLPHNMTMVMLGTGMLWFGWFGFNAGSALAANGVAVAAFVNTNTAAAAAALSWTVIEWRVKGKPTAFGLASGMVAGLAAVTQGAGFVTPLTAVVIGLLISPLCFGAILLKGKLGYDDSLDAFGIHGVSGTFGALATGVFACKAVNAAGADGWFYGNPAQFFIQLKGAAVVAAFAMIMTFLILKIVDLAIGNRVSAHEEEIGLDLTQHGESGYEL